jgi:hypothetical protein
MDDMVIPDEVRNALDKNRNEMIANMMQGVENATDLLRQQGADDRLCRVVDAHWAEIFSTCAVLSVQKAAPELDGDLVCNTYTMMLDQFIHGLDGPLDERKSKATKAVHAFVGWARKLVLDAEPLHVATINGNSLRLYLSPLKGPDLPWCAFDDLVKCFGISSEFGRHLKSHLGRHGKYKYEVRAVVTADGMVTIVPHYMVQVFLGAMEEQRQTHEGAFDDYLQAGLPAMSKLTDGMSFGSKEWFDWMKRLVSRRHPAGASSIFNPTLAFFEAAEKYGEVIHKDGENWLRITMPE